MKGIFSVASGAAREGEWWDLHAYEIMSGLHHNLHNESHTDGGSPTAEKRSNSTLLRKPANKNYTRKQRNKNYFRVA